MTTELTVYNTHAEKNWWLINLCAAIENAMGNDQQKKLAEILFITSFPPRECGIATYSQDLIQALDGKFENSFTISICALESRFEEHKYDPKPKYILNTDHKNAFEKTAFSINKNKAIQIVVMQHEFGFFSEKEEEFKSFIEQIQKPIVFVFHTVLPNPEENLKSKIQFMSKIASAIIVMTNSASAILMLDYNVPAFKISVIPHGTHLVQPLVKDTLKLQYKFQGRKIVSTFGLLSAGKGIETTLKAMPAIIAIHPESLFLVLGKTHPSVVKKEGELYRNLLIEKVKDLGLENHVLFVNRYLPLATLLEYLQLTDIYLFTSTDRNQAVSGTFAYAMSSGCPVISTPIPHAKEVLCEGAGIIIDFENAVELSNAVIDLLQDEDKRKQICLRAHHKMASTAWENAAIAHARLFENLSTQDISLKYRLPKINLNHIAKMTTTDGMLQFSTIAQPEVNSGYTLDDNARALILLCQHYAITSDIRDLVLINTYLQFIKHCQLNNGKFLNYVNTDNKFTDQNKIENLEDSNGRALWALGFLISMKGNIPDHFVDTATLILQKNIPHILNIYSTRAMAFIIKGLYYQNDADNYYFIVRLADRLVAMYQHESDDKWQWYEGYLTYGNSILPEAMLFAWIRTQNMTYKSVAKSSFDFLLSKTFNPNGISVVSNNGWLYRDKEAKEAEDGGKQPIDVAYTILALESFYKVFKNGQYKYKAEQAFSWFLGNNPLYQIIYNPCTGGCYDGLESQYVNLNQGAESTLSYHLARLAIDRIQENAHLQNANFTRRVISSLSL